MEHFLDTVETIEPGQGFTHFEPEHLAWLAAFVLAALGTCALYRHLDGVGRRRMRWAMAALLLLNEAFKTACLLIGGRWIPKYLPLHMCSLNIFLIALHAAHPSRLLGNHLWGIPILGVAMLALMYALAWPAWRKARRMPHGRAI